MNSPKAETGNNDNRNAGDLDRCYGRIGISAVAAALTYKGDSKNSAYAPSETPR
jgi:hypothetical protein